MKIPFLKKKTAIISANQLPYGSIILTPFYGQNFSNIKQAVQAGYMQNATVYACVRLIAQSIAQIEPYLLKDKGEEVEEIYQHEILDLLNRPSSDIPSVSKFFEILVTHLMLAGSCYIIKARGRGNKPISLFFIPPYEIKPENDGKSIIGFSMLKSGVTYPLEDVIFIREINPLNPFGSMSRLQTIGLDVDMENKAITWNNALLDNSGRPSGVFTTKEPMTETQLNRIKTLFENYQGFANAGKVPVLPFGLEWKEIGINPKDMDWINAVKLASRRICSVFGVPAELLGDAEAKTYSNYREARRAFWLETIIPLAKNIYAELNAQLVSEWKDENLRLVFDTDQIDALQENQAEKYNYLNTAWWLSLNEKRQACGYDTIPGGDYVFVASSLIPTLNTKKEIQPQTETEEEKSFKNKISYQIEKKSIVRWRDRKERDLLWNGFYYRVKTKEKSFQPVVEKILTKQVKEVIEKIKNARSLQVVRNIRLLDVEDEAKRYFSETKDVYLWHAAHGIRAGQRAIKGEIYELEEKFSLQDLSKPQREYLEQLIIDSGTKIAESTMREIVGLVLMAQNENWTVEELTQAIWEKFDIFTPWRARMISRTETAKTENWGELEAYRDDEFIELKGWLSARVPTSRDEHILAADRYEENPIPLDEPFEVGGEYLDYPGDPKGSPGNIINCLCSLYPATRD